MRKIIIFFMLIIIIVFLSSCKNSYEHKEKLQMATTKAETKRDFIKEYDLNELKRFFDSGSDKLSVFKDNSSKIRFSDANSFFPIEYTCSDKYSIYKVKQGGFYYLFWANPVGKGVEQESIVAFSTYLYSEKDITLFDSIKVKKSTAADVQRIDPYFELNLAISHGLFSFSYINENSLLEIEYEWVEDMNTYDDLVVKEIKIIERLNALSWYSLIEEKDLPTILVKS